MNRMRKMYWTDMIQTGIQFKKFIYLFIIEEINLSIFVSNENHSGNMTIKINLVLFLISLTVFKVKAQQTISDITGEYSLKGVPEMASGFRFNSDSTFQFFYIYGASDRQANGTYRNEGNKIVLSGTKTAGKDFSLIQKKNSGNGITVSITDKNKLLIQSVVCLFSNGKDTVLAETNSEGIAVADMPDCREIQLIHNYFPDSPTVIEVDLKESNFFEFSLNPSLAEVVFENFQMEQDENDPDVLYCSNKFLFPGDKVKFVKH